MLEYPEALVVSSQLCQAVRGRRIASVVAAHSPHKFAWYHGDPAGYDALLAGRTVGRSSAYGSLVEIEAENMRILFQDGVSPRLHQAGEPRPEKHQLLIEFEDGCALSGSIQMYGGLMAFREGEFDNRYYVEAKESPPMLSNRFDEGYFGVLLAAPEVQKLSTKAFLATEQRIPGLGNGVLQDILFAAKAHPRRKTAALSDAEKHCLFLSVKSVIGEMAAGGGRDTEKDLFGAPGGYQTKMSRNTLGAPCPSCGTAIAKEAYLGGAVYFCPRCQPL